MIDMALKYLTDFFRIKFAPVPAAEIVIPPGAECWRCTAVSDGKPVRAIVVLETAPESFKKMLDTQKH